MASGPFPRVIEHLHRVIADQGSCGVPDAELLERYIDRRDEAAFEILVWRHGRMVLRTCRRVLQNTQDAEDAFQACFLALARRAGAISRRESVAGWLYKVAYRLALGAKIRGAKRRSREHAVDGLALPARTPDPLADATMRELRPVLDEEVNRLPDKFRVPFVLCHLEGRTNREIACELGCCLGTVESRLTRARKRLRASLLRRGVALGAGLVALLAREKAAAACMSRMLVFSTTKAAMAPAASKAAAAGLISYHVAALTQGVLRTMLISKLKMIGGMVLAVAVMAAGAQQAIVRTLAGAQTGAAPKQAPQPVPAQADPGKVKLLIDQLGSGKFADREKATKELDEIGSLALDALRKAAKDEEPERKRRAEMLVQKIDGRRQNADLLAPKRVHLVYKDTPLVEAVADFKKKSGYELMLNDPDGKLKTRKITLDTGDVTFWKALELFCEKAGLVEEVAKPGAMGFGGGGFGVGVGGFGGGGGGGLGGAGGGKGGGGAGGGGAGGGGFGGAGGAGGGQGGGAGGGKGGGGGAGGGAAGGGFGGAGGAGGGQGGGAGGGKGGGGGAGGGGQGGGGGIGVIGGGAGGFTVSSVANAAQAAGQITLVNGQPVRLPGDLSSAFRIRALAPSDTVDPANKGDIMVALDFAVEPRMRWQKALTIRILKAVDDQGQTLEQNLEAKANAALPAFAPKVAAPVQVQGGQIFQMNTAAVVPDNKVWLKKGDKTSKSLKEIRGIVTAEVLDKEQPAITVTEILQSAGKTFKGTAGGVINIIDVKTMENGQVKIHFELQPVPGFAGIAGVKVGAAAGIQVTQMLSSEEELVLLDDKGRVMPRTATAFSINQGLISQTLTFMHTKGQGAPSTMVYSTRKSITLDVPFTLTDVPLTKN